MSQNDYLSEYDPQWAAMEPHFPKGIVVDTIPEFREKVAALRAHIDANAEKGASEGLQVIERYIPGGNGEIRLQAFIPDAREGEADGFPLLLWIMGGGWSVGTIEDEEPALRNLAVGSRIVCVCGDYHKAPEYPYPAAVNDNEAVLKWAMNNASELSINVSKGVVVGGLSAGANIGTVLAHRGLKDPGLQGIISGQMLIMPCVISPHAYPEKFKSELLSFDKDEDQHLLTQNQLLRFTEAYHGKDNAAHPEVSPLLADSFEGLPPAYFQIAGRDMLRDESFLYEKLLREANVPTKVDLYPGCPHGFHIVFKDFDATKRQKKDFAAGLEWLLRRTP